MSKSRYTNLKVANNMLDQAERDRDIYKVKAEFLASVLLARFDYAEDFVPRTEEEHRPLHERLRRALALAADLRQP